MRYAAALAVAVAMMLVAAPLAWALPCPGPAAPGSRAAFRLAWEDPEEVGATSPERMAPEGAGEVEVLPYEEDLPSAREDLDAQPPAADPADAGYTDDEGYFDDEEAPPPPPEEPAPNEELY